MLELCRVMFSLSQEDLQNKGAALLKLTKNGHTGWRGFPKAFLSDVTHMSIRFIAHEYCQNYTYRSVSTLANPPRFLRAHVNKYWMYRSVSTLANPPRFLRAHVNKIHIAHEYWQNYMYRSVSTLANPPRFLRAHVNTIHIAHEYWQNYYKNPSPCRRITLLQETTLPSTPLQHRHHVLGQTNTCLKTGVLSQHSSIASGEKGEAVSESCNTL